MDHPLLCNSQVVRNILARRQTQDRRPIKPQPFGDIEYWKCTPRDWSGWKKADNAYGEVEVYPCNMFSGIKSPFGDPGDVLVVSEGYEILARDTDKHWVKVRYLADDTVAKVILTDHEWSLWRARKRPYARTSSRYMYKSLARLKPTVKRVWVEQAQDISKADAIAEGIETSTAHGEPAYYLYNEKLHYTPDPIESFQTLLDSLYPGSWDRNDWLWCCEFEVEQ